MSNRATFEASLANPEPPADGEPMAVALWHIHHDNWDAAHDIVQKIETPVAAWIHAHLHRIEGDLRNAGYWYGRAERSACTAPLADEYADLVAEVVG